MESIDRPPVVSGMFYSKDPKQLKADLTTLFNSAKRIKPRNLAVVSPHAGYAYSGITAAKSIASLKPAKSFILIGPNHQASGIEFGIMRKGTWSTPLGKCEIDTALASKIKRRFLKEDPRTHLMEHSLEVQLPFLQYRFEKFKFVPISITNINYTDEFLGRCEKIAESVFKAVRSRAGKGSVGIIASSDFSHYIPANLAEHIDKEAMKFITKLDTVGLFEFLKKKRASVCGYGPIAVVMSVAQKLGLKSKVISYSHSGQSTGDLSSVVGYAAIGFG